jgi:hypothetical protein
VPRTAREPGERSAKKPSDKWNGCAWPALITTGHFTTSGLLVCNVSVTVVPSYRDSERMDMTVTFDKPFCGSRTHLRKDVPIIICSGSAGNGEGVLPVR